VPRHRPSLCRPSRSRRISRSLRSALRSYGQVSDQEGGDHVVASMATQDDADVVAHHSNNHRSKERGSQRIPYTRAPPRASV